MKKSKCLRKGLAVGIIVLFLGLAIAPSINANISKASVESELVEITTEVYGIDDAQHHTVRLTKQQAEELEVLFAKIKKNLDRAKNREETLEIFDEAVISLNEFGLLPHGMAIEDLQKFITGKIQNKRAIQYLEQTDSLNPHIFDNQSNYCCLVAGTTSETCFGGGPIAWLFLIRHISFLFLFLIEKWLRNHAFWILIEILGEIISSYSVLILIRWFALTIHSQLNPLPIANKIYLGKAGRIPGQGSFSNPAKGWIFTIGLNGIKRWSGSLWGDLPLKPMVLPSDLLNHYSGVLGFTGVKIINPLSGEAHYLGSALWAKIEG